MHSAVQAKSKRPTRAFHFLDHQDKLGRLCADSPCVQQGGTPLPTLESFSETIRSAKKTTVRDAWGLMLTAVPGAVIMYHLIIYLWPNASDAICSAPELWTMQIT